MNHQQIDSNHEQHSQHQQQKKYFFISRLIFIFLYFPDLKTEQINFYTSRFKLIYFHYLYAMQDNGRGD